MEKYYLAYGSNLNLERMAYFCPKAKAIGSINLSGYRLVYKGDSFNYAYLTIEEDDKSFVPMGLFELFDSDIKSLDAYEGYPDLYSKMYVPVEMDDTSVQALVYVMNDEYDYNIPSKNYIDICSIGYDDFGFDKEILTKALADTYKGLVKSKVKRCFNK